MTGFFLDLPPREAAMIFRQVRLLCRHHHTVVAATTLSSKKLRKDNLTDDGGPAGSSHNGRLSNARYYYGYAAKNVPLFRKIAFDTSNK